MAIRQDGFVSAVRFTLESSNESPARGLRACVGRSVTPSQRGGVTLRPTGVRPGAPLRFAAATRLLAIALAALVLQAGGHFAAAGVVVICNRTSETIVMETPSEGDGPIRRDLPPRGVVSLPAEGAVTIRYRAGSEVRRVELSASSIYGFFTPEDKLQLLPLLTSPKPGDGEPPAPRPTPPPVAKVCVVPVKILTDDDEATRRSYWEPVLRRRLEAASKVFERDCRVRFEVAAVDTWDSDDAIDDFEKSIEEFEREIDPRPGRLAIGFTSQYRIRRPGDHLGATRAPLHTHILIRDWVPHTTESERLEVLLHEMGHFLGASHAPEFDSVMRPNLADRRSRARSFRVGFDPFNTFIMYLLGEELRSGRYRGFRQLSPERKVYVRSAYEALAKVFPDDPTAARYLEFLDPPKSPDQRTAVAVNRQLDPVAGAAREVLRAITEAARENREAAKLGNEPLDGDRLTEHLVRRAAAAAAELPEAVAGRALLLGLGLGLDDSRALRKLPLFGELCESIEPDEERRQRLAVLGSPTMRGRRDLAQHFFVSAALVVMVGPKNAEKAGLLKEIHDARAGSGFSFADLAADLAGVALAVKLTKTEASPGELARSFTVAAYLPELAGLPEGIPWDEFTAKYSLTGDGAFEQQRTAIRRSIAALPVYQEE